ncbi:potassium/sodium hyperpolarization-activated cyclic nucleotide-gated channel 3-like [Diabrotica virgifera virgifera]|uniref:Potassium/sodium hyperpolarization-activated cyclic nucleotide-gated channel 3-like n=1 Tax=Diabrotica virgifera virgifera TaxID=50390 RepID=A0A6P7GXZ4_DIAVI|nr:potassium/sodium hyperpolarization-activated cyclic nucleotide-gated channel 3-like [Diabrotica virgifera virgifera]
MPHICILHKNSTLSDYVGVPKSRLQLGLRRLFIVSEDNVYSSVYFRSEKEIKSEKIRQLESGYSFIIHPLSKFRMYYEFWLVFLYAAVITVKALDAGIRDGAAGSCPVPENFKYQDQDHFFKIYAYISTSIDVISWSDILINFVTGYEVTKIRIIELRPTKIAIRYIFRSFFLIDLLGAIPRFTLRCLMDKPPLVALGIQNIFSLLKGIRFFSLLRILIRVLRHLGVKSRSWIYGTCYFAIFIFILHYSTMLMLGLPRIIRVYLGTGNCTLTVKREQIPLHVQYNDYMFETSAYFLQVALPKSYYRDLYFEEVILAIFFCMVGKIVMTVMWVALAASILNSQSSRTRYQALIVQVEEFMKQRNLPLELRQRILQNFSFKYQGNYFREDTLTFLLSDRLKKEVKLHLYSTITEKVGIFKILDVDALNDVLKVLKPEIVLQRDVICQSGAHGDCMYFIASGTVAVYTSNRQEMCHLVDGDYFGEICLMTKYNVRPLTVSAVETCQVYKLYQDDFENTLAKNKKVIKKMLSRMEKMVKKAEYLEKIYRKSIFEATYGYNVD